VPTADAGVGLPRQQLDVLTLATLDVLHHALALLLVENLAKLHRLRRTVIGRGAAVVKMGGDLTLSNARLQVI